MSDGDLILNHLERVAYIIKDGESVKLANFGDGSVLRPSAAQARRRPRQSRRDDPVDPFSADRPDLYHGKPEHRRFRPADFLGRRR